MFGTSATTPTQPIDVQELAFKQKVAQLLERLKTLLDSARLPQIAADVAHSYDDKFLLVEFLTKGALAGTIVALEALGLTEASLKQILVWRASLPSVTVRFAASEATSFIREVTREIEGPQTVVATTRSTTPTESAVAASSTSRTVASVVSKIVEYYWSFEVEYELFLFPGNNPAEKLVLQRRHAKHEIITTVKKPPQLDSKVFPCLDLNLTWLLDKVEDNSHTISFSIDRLKENCRTPSRNTEVSQATEFFAKLRSWGAQVDFYFDHLLALWQGHNLDAAAFKDISQLFVPIAPLFNSEPTEANEPPTSASLVNLSASLLPSRLIPISQLNKLLWEQKRSISEKLAQLSRALPAVVGTKLFTVAEAAIVLLVRHITDLCTSYRGSVDYIERMLRDQLKDAVGKTLTAADFADYIRFHQSRLFQAPYLPQPLCFAVRRPKHYPEGFVSIVPEDGTEPILASVRQIPSERTIPLHISLSSSTRVIVGGGRFVHATVQHKFGSAKAQRLNLLARARQFSSFILLVGRIASVDTFEPTGGVIIQNNDELTIPLTLEDIATPQQFADAISSMSPDQQRFCQAYREMQLQSTLFGLLVVQVKPHLERLLNLPPNSLTKEIALTQDIMKLFVRFRIPSDLIAFDSDAHPVADGFQRLAAVKDHVKALNVILENEKAKDLNQLTQQAYASAVAGGAGFATPASETPALAFGGAAAGTGNTFGSPASSNVSAFGGSSTVGFGTAVCAPSASWGAGGPFGGTSGANGGSGGLMGGNALSKAAPSGGAAFSFGATSGSTAPTVPTTPAPTPALSFNPPSAVESTPVFAALQLPPAASGQAAAGVFDFAAIPSKMDRNFALFDTESVLHPAIIKVGPVWQTLTQRGLLDQAEPGWMPAAAQQREKDCTFDLLDALSQSGSLPLDSAELHVITAASHSFDNTLIGTVIEDNLNPIEKVERSLLIVASTLFEVPIDDVVSESRRLEVARHSANLIPTAGSGISKIQE